MWLSAMAGPGSRSALNLIRDFGDAEGVYKAKASEIEKKGSVTDKRVLSRLDYKDLSETENILEWCDKNGVRIMVPTDADYPDGLKDLQDAPMALYVLGDLPDIDNTLCCAVVGTRNMSEYGKETAYSIGSGLADGGACIVSGLALGIDGMAMAGAIEAGGKTVAVLGCGIDIVYPKEHEKLLRKVIENGAVITEYAPGVSPKGYHFPVRNRLISGLCQAVCVVEGNMRSGSLITARHALYQGRTLFSVPGRIGEEGSEGTNFLLRQGAIAATGARDILSEFEFVYPHSLMLDMPVPHLSPDEAKEKLSVKSRAERKKNGKPKAEDQNDKNKSAVDTEPKKVKKKKSADKNPFPKKENERPKKKIELDTLSPEDIKVLEYMVPDVPMLAEEIAEGGFELSNVMVSLTLLEIAGAVEAGAGGYYLKRAADFGREPEYITEDDDGL